MRIRGVNPQLAPWWLRRIFAATQDTLRKLAGKPVLPDAVRANAHHPPLLFAVAGMEMAQAKVQTVSPAIKSLASSAVARMAGCPF